ncbi:hypothetical protein [Amorphus orientalis]|uniref:Uncharacterized protein n=1 Tax=Amorphus orientalis TaxID=649198 RepID=A0AAE4ATP1_9HYPH|nr:hypothetical protein [Amorphus orientalis]MDQ0316395.1 hypothetical protein [Amorphus orientalis]
MALSEQERQIVEYGKEQGKSRQQVLAALGKFRQQSQRPEGATKASVVERVSDVINTAGAGVEQNISGDGQFSGQSAIRRGTQAVATAASAVPQTVLAAAPEPIRAGVQKISDFVGSGFKKLTDAIGGTELFRGASGNLVVKPDGTYEFEPNDLGVTEEALGTAAAVGEVAGNIAGAQGTVNTLTRAKSLFTRPVSSVDDVIAQADDALSNSRAVDTPPPPPSSNRSGASTPADVRRQAVSSAPDLTLQEKWAGIQPDVKRRIAGKQEKLRDYFDVAHARNADDTAPTPYEYGARQAQSAVDEMESLLSETGGKIGATREKLGTYTAPIDAVNRIETTFTSQLDRLNLEVRNGRIRKKPGTITKAGTGDINALQEFYDNIGVVKQSPSLMNLIEARTAFDSRINFGKRAQEVSNEVDPLARQMRKEIADVAAGIVGKSEAAELKRFSDFMDAYSDLRSYTDRRAGGEYLLRLVLSGRGGEARQIVDTIREYTGIDLMDDATMMTIATDLIGNSRQKNLFRQEVTKSGLDAARALTGDTAGAAGLLADFIKDRFLDEEKIFLDAAK